MIYEKLLEVQKEIGAIKKDSENPFFRSKYFDINSLLAVVKPILNKHGVVLTQPLTHIQGKLAIRTVLALSTRQSVPNMLDADVVEPDLIASTCPIQEGIDPQKTGSAISYFRRYALVSLLALEAEDDDGNATSVVSTPKQASNGRTGATRPIVDDSQPPF